MIEGLKVTITEEEVRKAINSLKSGKVKCPERIIKELLIH